MLAVVESHMQRLLTVLYRGNKAEIEEEIKHFCLEVDAWLTDSAEEKAEVARQLTEFFQDTHHMEVCLDRDEAHALLFR